ncbi:MAG: helix-turn-helix domain-containing protein [Firmicutes bacterium]|nr:helix-turn-helix domain-containing protein [Bacillota bacterium]
MKEEKTKTLTQAVAERIRELLHQSNMTQYKFEQVSGISHGHLGHILYGRKSGSNKTMSFTTVVLIAKGFNMTLAQFLDSPIFDYSNFDIE